MKKIMLTIVAIMTLQSVRAEEMETMHLDLFDDQESVSLDITVHKQPKKEPLPWYKIPKVVAVYAYYNHIKPRLVAVGLIKDEEATSER